MSLALATVTVLLASITWMTVAQVCKPGWFGEECRYQCHCKDSSTCGVDGECSGQCEEFYFGPGCQYVDVLLYTSESTLEHYYLRDGDEKTCNPNQTATFVEVSLVNPKPFMWFRIQVNNAAYLWNFTVTLNDKDKCADETRFMMSNTSVHVACNGSVLLSKLRLDGLIAPSVCSIRISGGRNVAVKQAATQSSTKNNALTTSGAPNAVDGNRNQDFLNGSCILTEDGEEEPTWSLKYSRPQILIRVLIYGRLSFEYLLRGFTFEAKKEGGNFAVYYQDQSNGTLGVHDFTVNEDQPVTDIRIRKLTGIVTADKCIGFCEVETYGETVCPEGTFGLYCHKICRCDDLEECNVVTGACRDGCRSGFYKSDCSLECATNCQQHLCHQDSGKCIGCEGGFMGDFCSQVCPDGRYGENCNYNCSPHCSALCAKDDGFCKCNPPFVGPRCTDCPSGHFGDQCTKNCPVSCANGSCDVGSGHCKGCVKNHAGNYCEDCQTGFYGKECKQCSPYCVNRTCDSSTGTCPDCVPGYTGSKCAQSTAANETSIPWYYLLIPVPIILIIIAAVLFIVPKMRRRHDGEEEH